MAPLSPFGYVLLAAFFQVAGVPPARADDAAAWWQELALARDDQDLATTAELTHRLALLPGTVETDRELGEACLEASNWKDLDVVLNRLAAAGPEQEPWVLSFKARKQAATSDHVAALQTWYCLLHRTDLSAAQQLQAWEGLASAHEALGHWEEACVAVSQLILLDDSAEHRLWRVRLLVQQRRWDDLRGEALVLKTRFVSFGDVKAVYPRLERLLQRSDLLEAAEKLVAQSPTAPSPRLKRAVLESHLGLWRLAAEDFRAVAEQNPRLHAACLLASEIGLGDRLSLGGFYGDKPSRVVWLASSSQVAQLEARLDGHTEAWETLWGVTERLLEIPYEQVATREVAVLLAQQALAEYQLDWTTLANSDAREALTLAPDAWEAKWVRSRVLASRHRVGEALSLLRSCNPGGPLDATTVPALIQETAIQWLQALGMHEEAVKVVTTCLERERRRDLLRARARSLEILGRTDEACADIEESERDELSCEDDEPLDPQANTENGADDDGISEARDSEEVNL